MPSSTSGSPRSSRTSKRRGKKQRDKGDEAEQKQQQAASEEQQQPQQDASVEEQQQKAAKGEADTGAVSQLLPEGERDGVAQQQQQEEHETRGSVEEERGGGKEKDAETATAQAAAAADAATAAEEEDEEQKKQIESFDIYNKGLTSLMTFDEAGHPILVPLAESAEAAAALRLLPTTTTAAASDDTEGQYEAVPPPQGPCAGLCPPYGALPEQMPLLETAKEKQEGVDADAKSSVLRRVAGKGGGKVVEEEGHLYVVNKLGSSLSLFTLPSREGLAVGFPLERDCPVPLWQHFPPSPFMNRKQVIGVDVYAITEDLGSPEYRHAIPLYDFEAVTEAAAAAGREIQEEEQQIIKQRTGDASFFNRLDTLAKSQLHPGEIALD